ncbi:MAG TPA: ribosome silencing factor, partial [Saprospiraceae bacterium]|nr:ribosome silencing factor [Saprospiraceae bacterium]
AVPNGLQDLIIDCITDIKGKKIVLLNLRALDDAPADYFIVCEGESTTQVRAIAGNIERRLRDEIKLRPGHIEGTQHAKWICMDYFDTVVHIFYPETRRFYDLEQLWSDAERIEYQDV